MTKRPRKQILVLMLALLLALAFGLPETASAVSKAPDRVTVIKASSTYNSVTLNWKQSKGADYYIVYRAGHKYGLYQQIDTVSGNTFTDAKLQTGKAVWYKIRAVNEDRRSRKSPRISAVPSLQAPKLKAEAAGEGIYLSLEKVAGADGYVIYRDGKSLGAQKRLTLLDNKVYAGKNHRYRAVAYRAVGQKIVASGFSKDVRATRPNLTLNLQANNTVPDLHQGEEFEFKGKIASNTTIEKVKVGIVDRDTDKWLKGFKYTDSQLKEKQFDLAEVNEKVDISKLEQGKYYYRITVNLKTGGEKTLLNKEFDITEPPGGVRIVEKAYECAWPLGTPKSKYKYKSGNRTDAYTEALSQAYGSRKNWGAQARAGASCDVFVGTVVRASGYDTGFPRGLDGVESHCKAHPEKWDNLGAVEVGQLQPGDVVYQIFNSGNGHITIYLGDGLVANAHYMSKTYGIVEKASSKIRSKSGCKKYIVYRPIQ